jgi:predicted nucleotidyltransferase
MPDLTDCLETLRRTGQARLDAEESTALAYALRVAPPGEIALFGSRVESGRRGGDIDVLLLTDAPAFETAQAIAVRFFSRCEEKIDVVVINPELTTPEQQDFLNRIKRVRLQ